MRRLYTFIALFMAVSLTFAQAPMPKRAKSGKKLERMLSVNELSQKAKATKEMKAAMEEKAAAQKEEATSVFRTNAAKTWGGSIFESVKGTPLTTTWSLKGFMRDVPNKPYKSTAQKTTTKEGNVTVTTDAHGIITDVAGVEPKQYERAATGTVYVVTNTSVSFANQSGVVSIIEDGNNVYIKNPVARLETGAWVKGTKNGNTITVAAKQPLLYSDDYDATVILRWGKISGTKIGIDATNTDNFTYTVSEDVLTLQGTLGYENAQGADAPFMGVFWDDDNSMVGGEAETVLIYDATYTPPSTELVTLPAGVEYTGWYMNCTSVSSKGETPIKNQSVNVAFVGNDVYVQGISTAFSTAWVKGTIDGTTITFDKFQYVGAYNGSMDCWFIGVNIDDTTAEIADAKATYNAETKTITFTNDVLINAATDRIYYLNWFAEAVISAKEIVFEEPIITELTATLPYINTFETEAEQAEAAIYDANDDQSTFTFDKPSGIEGTVARYRYNNGSDADDYLVFPGVELKKGKTYRVSVDASGNGATFPERFEVVAGKVAKASQLTIPVIAPTEVKSNKEFTTYSNGNFTVEEDGTYFIAVHAISDAGMFYLFIDNFSIKENDASAPAPVTDLVLTPDPDGANKVDISFTAPDKTVGGDNITGTVRVQIDRDGENQTILDVAAGATGTYTDVTGLTGGEHTYRLTSMLDDKKGEPVSATTYVGWDTPDVVSNVTVADKSGSVALAWDAPAKGANGYAFKVEDCKYNIYPVKFIEFWGMTFPSSDYDNPYATDLTETSANVAFDTNEGEMGFTYFSVTAENTAGESEDAYGAVVTGAPYQIPVFESVTDGKLSYWWGTACDQYNQYLEGGLYLGETSSDGDGVCFQFAAETAGWMTLESGKIALNGAVNPVVTFDYSGAATLEVSVITPNGEKAMTTLTAAGTDFAPASISLKDFANEDWIRVIIKGTFEAKGDAYVDNIRIYNQLDNNLVAKGITATSKITAGDDVNIAVTVENQGSLTAEAGAYTVELYCNDEMVDSKAGVELARSATATFDFTQTTNVMSPEEMIWKAVVVFEADGDKTNNETATAKTTIKTNNFPVATDLAGEQEGENVVLTWNEPNMDEVQAEPVTDSFEDYESFALNTAGDWTFVDLDGSATYGIEGIDFPNAGSAMAYIVFDGAYAGFDGNAAYAAHTGNKCMASFAAGEKGKQPNNDWMISPELCGAAQTVSFFARTFDDYYGNESFEFYYSTTGKNIGDFVKVKAVDAVPTAWTEYTYNIPEGAKYFAIRCTSSDQFIFMVDDVTYTPAGASAADLSIVGYNIYRDGVKINEEPVAETTYTDAAVAEGDHSYVVTVVYDKGESKPSNVFTITTTGINSIFNAGTKVSAANRVITVTGAEGKQVSVYTTDGKTVYDGAGKDVTRINVTSGVYIVKVGNSVAKAVVR